MHNLSEGAADTHVPKTWAHPLLFWPNRWHCFNISTKFPAEPRPVTKYLRCQFAPVLLLYPRGSRLHNCFVCKWGGPHTAAGSEWKVFLPSLVGRQSATNRCYLVSEALQSWESVQVGTGVSTSCGLEAAGVCQQCFRYTRSCARRTWTAIALVRTPNDSKTCTQQDRDTVAVRPKRLTVKTQQSVRSRTVRRVQAQQHRLTIPTVLSVTSTLPMRRLRCATVLRSQHGTSRLKIRMIRIVTEQLMDQWYKPKCTPRPPPAPRSTTSPYCCK